MEAVRFSGMAAIFHLRRLVAAEKRLAMIAIVAGKGS